MVSGLLNQDGRLAFEVSGLGSDSAPMALTGDGRVLLAATSRGSIISVGWPRNPAASNGSLPSAGFTTAGNLADPTQQRQTAQGMASSVGEAAGHAGKHHRLHVQIDLGDVEGTAGSLAGGNLPGAGGSHAGGSPSSPCARASMYGSTVGTPTAGSKEGSSRMSVFNKSKLQPLQLQDLLDPDTPSGSPSGMGWSAAASPALHCASTASAAGTGAGTGAAVAGCGAGMMEHRLHAARITAVRVLHTAGAVFSAR
jgi:hypothetical protein